MSEANKPKDRATPGAADETYKPETQSERWVKYGSNVVLAVVLVVVIAGLLVYIFQRYDHRIDTTSSGVYSLKPQTKAVLSDLKQKVTLVSLYAKTTKQQQTDADGTRLTNPAADQAQAVADLLDEYKSNGKNVDVQIIDPINEVDKVAKLKAQIVADYGGQIQSYKDYLADWDKTAKSLGATMATQAADLSKIVGGGGASIGTDEDEDAPSGAEVPGLPSEIIRVIKRSPKELSSEQEELNRARGEKYPKWKEITDGLQTNYLSRVSKNDEAIANYFGKYKDNTSVAANVRAFMADNQPKFEAMKKQVDDLIARQTKLGELKVDQLEQALNVQDPILVLGPTDWRILQHNQVWSEDADLKNMTAGKILPRFSGEQQVTAAIYSLTTTTKPKVCFVRPGGEPVTAAGFPPFIPSGLLSQFATRLKQYNFDVTEKDLSGTWQMQAQMRRMPSPPEPSDEDIKDAIWVVLDMPREFSAGQQEGMPPTPIGPKVKAHLDAGGSALIIFDYQAEDLKGALDSFGIDLRPDAVAAHEPLKLAEGSPPNLIESAKARPPVFILQQYGNHPIVDPVKNLASLWYPASVVQTHTAKDATTTPLFPMDSAYPNVKVWGETDVEPLFRNEGAPTFDKDKDIAGPIWGGAAAEKKSGGRVVVMGSPIMFDGRINFPDPEILQKQGRRVALFPADGDVSANSLFWLAHLEKLIAISPEAMDVSRISDMSGAALGFWRYGVLMILLPIGVLAAGLFVYAGRRD